MLGSNTYKLVSDGGQVEEVVAADQHNPYHGESPKSHEVDAEGGSESAPTGDLPVSQETEATLKRALGRPPRARSGATAPADLPPVGQGVANLSRRERGRPSKHP